MPELLIGAVQLGGYISPVKLVVFLAFFFAWLWLVVWVHDDAKDIGTKEGLWTGVVLAGGAVGTLLWLFIPVFLVGLGLYLIAIVATSLSYVMHRNAVVPDYDRVLTKEHLTGLFSNQEKKREGFEQLGFITANENDVPVPEPRTKEFFGFKIAHDLFKDALGRRAGDITLTPAANAYNLSYIIDGAPLNQPQMTKDRVETLSDFLKHLADLDPAEKRKPQKGNFRIRQPKVTGQWEISTAGSTAGEHIRLKQVTQDTAMKLSELSLPPDQLQQLSALASAGKGLFLVSGPRLSGVTTTFYALLRNHDAFLNSITTLELNPTVELPNVDQQVFSLGNSGTSTYARKLMSMVRMGPDIIGAVDIKDADTAKVVCHAAKEGALVYAAIQADNVIAAIAKMIKLIDKKTLADNILGASSQRLFRKLCPACKQAYEPNKDLVRKFNIPPQKAKVLYRAGKVVYDKRGKPTPCQTCHEIGYFGRTCAFEIIIFNNELRKALLEAKSFQELATHFRRARMKYLQEQILEKVLDGTTSVNEMIRVLAGPKQAKQTADQ
jgi:type II secretory ATPase GspE/PulE/Tfp pilus assembly ATPase PilB-like protein